MNHRELAAAEISRCAEVFLRNHGMVCVASVSWDLRGLTAGKARHSHIRLNEAMAIAEGPNFVDTVAHEYAHCCVNLLRLDYMMKHADRAPRGAHWRSHGSIWAGIMREFGWPAHRTHCYQSAKRAIERRSYIYACGCHEHKISIVRHRKIQNNTARYRCKSCRGQLEFRRAA